MNLTIIDMAVMRSSQIFCTFAECPVSDYELTIAQTLCGLLYAYNQKDAIAVINYFTHDARIDSLIGGGVVTRDQYKRVLETHYPHITSVRMDQINILLKNPRQVDAYGMFKIELRDGRHIGNLCLVRFAYIDEVWQIIGTQFVTREIFHTSIDSR